jgi:hypothetical protein
MAPDNVDCSGQFVLKRCGLCYFAIQRLVLELPRTYNTATDSPMHSMNAVEINTHSKAKKGYKTCLDHLFLSLIVHRWS